MRSSSTPPADQGGRLHLEKSFSLLNLMNKLKAEAEAGNNDVGGGGAAEIMEEAEAEAAEIITEAETKDGGNNDVGGGGAREIMT